MNIDLYKLDKSTPKSRARLPLAERVWLEAMKRLTRRGIETHFDFNGFLKQALERAFSPSTQERRIVFVEEVGSLEMFIHCEFHRYGRVSQKDRTPKVVVDIKLSIQVQAIVSKHDSIQLNFYGLQA